jgi:hypothetical protein
MRRFAPIAFIQILSLLFMRFSQRMSVGSLARANPAPSMAALTSSSLLNVMNASTGRVFFSLKAFFWIFSSISFTFLKSSF